MAGLLAAFSGSPPTSNPPSKPSLSSLAASTIFVASNSLRASSVSRRLKVRNPSSSPPSDGCTPSVPLLALNGLAADEVDDGSLEREAPPSLFPIFEYVSLCSVPPLLLLAGPHGAGQSLPLLLPSQKSPPPLFPCPLAEPLSLPSHPSSPPLLQIFAPSFFLTPSAPSFADSGSPLLVSGCSENDGLAWSCPIRFSLLWLFRRSRLLNPAEAGWFFPLATLARLCVLLGLEVLVLQRCLTGLLLDLGATLCFPDI